MTTADIPAADGDGPTAKTTMTSFRVVEALKDRDGAGVSELADELGLAKGTVHKHLTTLRQLDYVVKDDHTYRLSIRFLGLGTTVRARLPIYEAAQQPLEHLATATGETASLIIPEHGYGVYILRENRRNETDAGEKEGDRIPLHATASGKAILSYTPAEKRTQILDYRGLPAVTDNTITDRDTLEDELQLVRDRRMAYDRAEYREGWHCLACPVLNSNGRAIAAVTVSGTATKMKQKSASTDFASIVGSTINSIQNTLDNDFQ